MRADPQRSNRRYRVGVLTLPVALFVGLLSACDQFDESPTAIRLESTGNLEVAVCESIIANRILMSVTLSDGAERIIWEGRSSGVEITSGTILNNSNIVDFFPDIVPTTDLSAGPGTGVGIVIGAVGGNGMYGTFVIADSHDWLHDSGAVTKVPCE